MRVEDISFSYPARPVFESWSAEFGAGLTWLRGGNGCGKSTLLKLLAGALRPSVGDIEVQGLRQSRQPIEYRRAVFWCGPGPVPFDHLSPTEYFAFMRGLYPGWDDGAVSSHVAGFALVPHLRAPLRTLSTGTQRKVWLTAALSAGTAVTLLDEPVNALDAASLGHLLSAMAQRAADASRAWIVASHESLGDGVQVAATLELSGEPGSHPQARR